MAQAAPPPPVPLSASSPARTSNKNLRFLVVLGIGALVALSLGLYGKVHDPTGRSLITGFFSDTITLKAWFATAAVVLAIGQLIGGLWMYGKLGKSRPPRWVRTGHRFAGTAAFFFTIPVAYHCLWALGFHANQGTRVLVHGTLGCVFFGALTTKVLVVRQGRMPKWALPVMGGTLFAVLVLVWTTSALWYFKEFGVKF